MIELVCGVGDLARIRFGRSPMQELVSSLLVGGRADRVRMHRSWARSVSAVVASLELDLVRALLAGRRYFPDFLTPSPERLDTRFGDELDRVRATPADVVREQLDLLQMTDALLPLYDDPERHLGALALELRDYWEAAIEPIWPRLAALLDAEVGHRAEQLTSGGVVRLLGNLHPELEYAQDALRILWPAWDMRSTLGGGGVLLVPCVFVWPSLLVETDSRAPKLVYSPRGVGQVWDGSARRPEAPIAELLGRSRAALLARLDLPLSTTQLAREAGQSAATVSEHLAVLRRAGLVSGRRSGRSVLYQRTLLGTDLLGAGGDLSARGESWSRRAG